MKPQQIRMFLKEDAPHGDITTQAVFGVARQKVRAEIVAKQDLVVSGFRCVRQILKSGFPGLKLAVSCPDGLVAKNGRVLATLSGRVTDILIAERLILNILQHLSGIALLTSLFVNRARGSGVKILDTRKTTPGLRVEEKQAVRDGGGFNHRLNLSDQYLIKDNHIDAAGSVTQAFRQVMRHQARSRVKKKIEIEVRGLSEFREALALRPDIIMLDNISLSQIRHLVDLRNQFSKKRRPELEISGGVTLENLDRYLHLGVERISVGALTHSVMAADIALNIIST